MTEGSGLSNPAAQVAYGVNFCPRLASQAWSMSGKSPRNPPPGSPFADGVDVSLRRSVGVQHRPTIVGSFLLDADCLIHTLIDQEGMQA